MYDRVRNLAVVLAVWILGIGTLKADLTYYIEPVDSVTRMPVRDVEVVAFVPGDSVAVAEGQSISIMLDGMIERQVKQLNFPLKDADYTLYIDAPGYEPRLMPLHTKKASDEYALHSLGEIGLLRSPRRLDEVTVTATKIKMYYKGDTIVYNADAFLLPEGSMLDDLIRKLPGITINRNGEIFSNGRKIESLQLDGRRLFDGSPRTLLENLGAYTVSKVKVYEQTDRQSEFLGYTDEGHRPLVMDVNLKKEYSIGKWVNIDAGYGTHNRYLGRGFMLGFSKTVALSAFVNANNLSAESDPDRYDYWGTDKVGASESSYLSGGLSYNYNGAGGKRLIKGSIAVNSSKVTERSGTDRINFLPTGDTYESRFKTQNSRSFSFNTNHSLTHQSARTWLDIKPQFSFSRHNSDGNNVGAAFDENPGSVSAAEIEAIFSGSEEKLREYLINRELRRNKNNTSQIGGNLNGLLLVKLTESEKFRHNLTFSLGGSYNNYKRNNYNQYSIEYGAPEVPPISEYAYTRGHPSDNASIKGSAKYEINWAGRHTVSFNYSYGHDQTRNTTNRYLLGDLQEATFESLIFGQAPADDLLSDVLDPVNSNNSDYKSNSHTLAINSRLVWGTRDLDRESSFGNILLFVNPSLRILDRSYDFHKIGYDTTAVRSFVLPQINARLNYAADQCDDKYSYFASIGWDSNPGLFAMNNLINVYNTADPLNIFRGNPDLRTSYTHTATLQLQFVKKKGTRQFHQLAFNYTFTKDAIVSGVIYDPTTGVRTRSMYNVDGAREINVSYTGDGGIIKWSGGPLRSLDYSVGLLAYATRSVNMVGSEDLSPVQSYVFSRHVSPNAKLMLAFGAGHQVNLSCNGNFARYSGENLTAFTSSNTSYRLGATFRLPADIRLSSDLTLHCRRGYAESALNTDEYLWNASASWYWKKMRLTFALDGYDLLHQIKAISQYVDPLGRTASWSNTLPRYAMLRIRYHLDLSPR